jgi:hypothetical protein
MSAGHNVDKARQTPGLFIPQTSETGVSIPRVAGGRFNVGKYIVVAEPIPHSAQMLRYTVFVGPKRIGSLASMPSEADCLYLEKPPIVPPLKVFHVTNRPGRPKKNVKPVAPLIDGLAPQPTSEER